MVIHNPQQQQALFQQTAEKKKEKTIRRHRGGGWSVLTIQSLACTVLLLVAVMFRLAGGGAYDQLRQGFRAALMKNELMTVLARLWDGEVGLTADEEGNAVVKSSHFTEEDSLILTASSSIQRGWMDYV